MAKRMRTILFLIFLFLFLIIAPLAVFYSQGYRIDSNPPPGGKVITQTGGIFLKVEPKQAEIYLDEKLVKKTDFFFGSTLIENLLPKKYKIEVKKEGYQSWTIILEIKEKEVTEAKNIVLFPKDINLATLTRGIEDLWFSPDEKKITLKEDNEENKWSLKLYDLDRNIKSHLISETDIYPRGADLMNLEFSDDSKEIYLDTGVKEQEKYFTLKLDKSPPQLVERKISPPPENILASQKINNDFYYLDNSGYVFKNGAQLNEKPFPVQPETKYDLEIFSNFIFLKEGQNLFLLNADVKSFEKFFDGVKLLKVSPDKEKMVYFSDSEIWILFFKDKSAEPIKKAGEKLFLLRLSEKIGNCFWLNNNYLLFNSGDKIKISEIDERDKINIIDIVEIKNPRIIWNKTNEKLYVLSEGTLYESPKLLP